MKLEEIRSQIEELSKIDISALDHESLKIPLLHSTWYNIYTDERRVLVGIEMELTRLIKFKTEYYLGRCEDQVYKDFPLDQKILKPDLPVYLNADEEVLKLEGRKKLQQMKVDTIESFIKSLNQRSFYISNAVNFLKFKNGIS